MKTLHIIIAAILLLALGGLSTFLFIRWKSEKESRETLEVQVERLKDEVLSKQQNIIFEDANTDSLVSIIAIKDARILQLLSTTDKQYLRIKKYQARYDSVRNEIKNIVLSSDISELEQLLSKYANRNY